MKKIISLTFVSILITFVSCKKDSPATSPASNPVVNTQPPVQDANLIGVWVQDSNKMDTSKTVIDSICMSMGYRDTIYITNTSYIERGWQYSSSKWLLNSPQFTWNWQVNDSLKLQCSILTQYFQYSIHGKVLYFKGFNGNLTVDMYANQLWYHRIH